jgi:hypothetical protein
MDSIDNVTWRLVQQFRPVITATRCNGKPSHTTQPSRSPTEKTSSTIQRMLQPRPGTRAVRLETAVAESHAVVRRVVTCLSCFSPHRVNHKSSWALLKKPPVAQLLKVFQTFYGNRRFIAAFTRAPTGLYSGSDKWIHTTKFYLRSILILSIHLCFGLPSCSFFVASQPILYFHNCEWQQN